MSSNVKRIYLDHAATTPIDPRVLSAVHDLVLEGFGNPSSLHSFGRDAKLALESARENIAKRIGADASEIIFTSGGSESDNLAIKGAAFLARRDHGKDHIITSAIEHDAVLRTCKFLEREGFKLTVVPVSRSEGIVNPEDIENAITEKTALVTIMHANNEIGTIQPIKEISEITRKHGIPFHTDAVQTVGNVNVDVNELGVDLLSASSHKFYGPKGVGFVYKRDGVKLIPQIHGGGQERNLRGGTENVTGIVGMSAALEISSAGIYENAKRIEAMRDALIDGILGRVGNSWLNGSRTIRLPGNANFGFGGIEGEATVLRLDMAGIAASTGSACSSTSLKPSHVLIALGLSPVQAHGSLRLSLGRGNTMEEVDITINAVSGVVEKLRKISPLKKECTGTGTVAGD